MAKIDFENRYTFAGKVQSARRWERKPQREGDPKDPMVTVTVAGIGMTEECTFPGSVVSTLPKSGDMVRCVGEKVQTERATFIKWHSLEA